MAGVTDTLFRRVIHGLGGCGLLMTEFTSSEGITAQRQENFALPSTSRKTSIPSPRSFLARIPPSWPKPQKMVEDLGYDAVDINSRLPAKKVVKCGGSGLLR